MSKSEYYSKFLGLKRAAQSADLPQVSFLILVNFLVNKIKGALVKRAGSKAWSTTGTTYGLGEYSKSQTSLLTPNLSYIVRHRRNAGTSSLEYYDATLDSWETITLGAQASLGIQGVATFAQCNTMMAICAGQPGKLLDPTSDDFERLGGPAPTAAPTWGTSGTGLTGTTSGYYTFYDSTTGWESSPSPITASTTLTNDQLDWSALEVTCDREGVDKKRLYRTQLAAEGEGPYYRVAEIALATTTYADTVADASLGTTGPDVADHDPPPTTSYLVIEYENRFWIASDTALWYSKQFDGSNYQLEYFSPTRVEYFPSKITGLAYSPDFGKLLVFCSPGQGIHYISGRSESTFERGLFKKEEGTQFPSSISVHEESVAYWGSNGPSILTPSGTVKTFGDDLKESLRSLSTKEYDSDIWVFSLWHPVMEQFLWFISATDSATASWENSLLGNDVQWEDIDTGSVVEWE